MAAQRVAGGVVELALQQTAGGAWSERILGERRFVAADAAPGRWKWGPELTVTNSAAHDISARVVARRLTDGRVEVGLQQRPEDGAWSDRLLPERRYVPAGTALGRWLVSSPVDLMNPDGFVVSDTGSSDIEQRMPEALVTPTGVPVAVLERTTDGYLVRTPCGNAAEVSDGTPLNGVQVVVDPGHGGRHDFGAIGPNGLTERDLNLTLGSAVVEALTARGISAVATRTGNYASLLWVRAALADALGADALISIHHNAPSPSRSTRPGTEVYVQSASAKQPDPDSSRLGGLLYTHITEELSEFSGVTWRSRRDAGVLRVRLPRGANNYPNDSYGMIRRPNVPAVLIEYGYLSNRSEAQLFATDEYVSAAARATANAVAEYLATDRTGSGFVEQPRYFNPGRANSRCDDIKLQ